MENNKKLSLDDIFGKPSTTQQPQSKMDLETIFGKKVEPASVAPEGTTIDSMRNISIAPISFPKVEVEQQGVIGEDVLQASRSAFEKEIAADQGPIFPPKQDYAPLNPASIKIGRAMPEVGSVDKPKNLQQTVRSEISKEWGGDLRKFVEDTHKAPAENIQMANDMEAHFWNVMTDKLPKDGFISQEDMDPYSFVRKYDNGDEVTEYSLGHYTYPQEVVNEYIARHNDEVLHEMRFKDDAAYRNDWFLRNVGVTEQVYRDEIADDLESRLQELRKKIVATLPAQHTRGGYAAIGAAANKPSSGAPVSIEKIDKALKVVNTLRKNNFGAGLKEGFDPADILTLGVSGIGENVALLNALNKSTSGKTLTNAEQALVEAWDIQNEAEEVINTLGGRTLGANIGRGSAMSLGFVTQTLGTSGIASLATKGISRAAARTALRRAANTGLSNQIKEGLRYGGLKVVESAVGAAARTPFMGFTYRNYTDKRLDQFQVKERLNQATGEVGKYIDKQDASALRDAVHTALESFFESQSEDVGGLIDLGITSFARALPLNKMIRSAAINGLTGPVQSGAMRWLRESAKIYGLAGETLSEAYGDAMVNLLTSNSDGWKQMATSEYWWELIGVSSMLSGGFGVVNRGVNWVNNREISRDISKSEQLLRNSLSRIEDDNLKKELTEATLTDDVIDRSKRLSSLDWSNFSREDMANAVDFIDAQTRLDVMREGATESRRLARIMPAIDEVKKLVDGGALDDEQAAASLATIYSDLFRTQENQRTLNILTDRIKVAADAGISADKINDILRGAGLTVFNPGDEIETLTGDRAIVDKVLPGAYEIVNDEGVREVVSFEEVLQNAPEIRQIQQESQQPVTQSESAPEINPQVEQAVESARQEAEAIKNLDDDVIYEATLSDGTPVNIIKGANIVYNNQTGEVDYDASDATVVVRSNDGSKRQISIRDIDSIDQAMSVYEALQVATEAAVEVVNSQEQSETPTAEVSSAQAEIPIVQEAEATTAEQASESPATQPEQQAQIPTLKNGDPDYNAMDAQMFTEQYVSRFGEDMTERVARNNIKASNKTISNIEKQIEDVTDPNKMPALYSKLQDAQATKDKYEAVLEELGLSSDENEDNAARVQRKKQENTSWFNKLFPDGFPNVESVILWDIANGNRIRWANKEVNGAVVSKGLGSELGLADSNAERTRRIALIGKDAPTPEEYAEQLPERLKSMGVRFEEGELRDKVLDVYASVDTVRKAKEELEKMSANIQAEQEGLDYEEEQMRRNYEREQGALRQEVQTEGIAAPEEELQPLDTTNEEDLSIEDEVPFMVSSDSVQATTEAQKLATEAAIIALEDAGVEVVNATPEMVEEALQQRDVQWQAVEDRLITLQKAEKFVAASLQGKKRNKSFRLTLPALTLRKIRAAIGRDFDNHNLDGNSFVHSKRLHGINGEKIDANSIPLSDKDFALAPYIMVAPDRVVKGSNDAVGRESIRFEKTLSNGVVVVVEKEQKNSPTDMDTITMWADLSGSVMHGQSPASTIVRDVIATMDDAKIRKDAENTIRKDVQMHIEQQNSIDAAYMDAVETGDIERAKALVREYAESRGYYLFGEFRDAHAAPSSTVDKPDFTNADLINEKSLDEGWDVNLYSLPQGENLAPNDFWSPMGPRWYMYNNKAGMEAHSAIVPAIRSIQYQIKAYGEVRDMPSVKVYRAVPNSVVVNSLENGDWVTPSLTYANTHGLARFGESEYRIIEQEVPATDLWWDGNDAREWGYDNGNVEAYANTTNHIKSLDPITYDDANNMIPLSARFDASTADSRFSIGPAPVFVSNAKIAVLGIKQDKATPEQWLKMIEKAGGLKAGEDKWIGLSDWLKASDKKTLTKQEVLDYINENQIQIEETTYSSNSAVETTPEFIAMRDVFRAHKQRYEEETRRNLEEYESRLAAKYNFPENEFDTTVLNPDEEKAHASLHRAIGEADDAAWAEMIDEYGDDFDIAFWNIGGGHIRVDNAEAAGILLGLPIDRPIYHLREDYTAKGLEANREIALTVPTIEPWNENDEIHFGDAGEGRAIAWVRFGETTALTDEAITAKKAVEDYLASMREKYGSKEGEETDAMTADEIDHLQSLTAKEIESRENSLRVLAIDEIQSKRHQEGRERGYGFEGDVTKAREDADEAYRKVVSFENDMTSKYGDQYWTGDATNEEVAHWELLRSELDRLGVIYENLAEKQRKSVPGAPFEKNWAELAMKRMLRYAAENGFDKVAWTKGDQQAERYSLGAVLQGLKAYKTSPNTYYVIPYNNGAIGEFVKEYTEKELADTFGKELAVKIIANTEGATEDNPYEIEGDNLRIGGEGMRAFYDQMLPSFMRKYGKKWGATVQDVTLPYVEEAGRTMHSVDVTDSMRESVMQGQPMFYRRPNGTVYGWTNGTTVYLTESGMNPNTPIHEYTHIWSDAMRKHNPEGWASIVKLLKGTPVWNEVMADTNYANIHGDENKVASEALSRISGRENSAKMEAMAQLMIDENANDTVKKNRARKLLDRMRKALQEFWSWVGKELFGIKNFERIEQVTDRILYDLVSGTDLAATPSLAGQVKAVIDEYDNADEVFTINDVAARISEVVNNYTGTESTTELENILEDFEGAQNSAGRYGYRMDSGGEDAFEEALRAYAAKAPIEGFSIQPQERAEIIRAAKANGTYLKAPNGKDTNLTPEQWVTVRTKAFKRWFGDWENGGASSQILDANGEPLVVWHGGEFATDEFVANGSMHFGTKVAALQRILDNAWGYGNWTVGRNAEGRWSWKYTDPDDTGHDKQGETAFALPIDALVDAAHVAAPNAVVRPYYLNIRNLERTEDQNSDWVDAVSFSMDAGHDGIIYRNEFEDEGEDSYIAFYSNQIKLAEGNTTFDPNDDDVRFRIGEDTGVAHAESIAEKVGKSLEKYGISTDAIIAPTPGDFFDAMVSLGVDENLIDNSRKAVYVPKANMIIVNSSLIESDEDLLESLIHEEFHKLILLEDSLEMLADAVDALGEQRIIEFASQYIEDYPDGYTAANEIISNFAELAALMKIDGKYAIIGLMNGEVTAGNLTEFFKDQLVVEDDYSDVVDGLLPILRNNYQKLKNSKDEGRGKTNLVSIRTGRSRDSVKTNQGNFVEADNIPETSQTFSDATIGLQGRGANQSERTIRAGSNSLLEGVNEFSIGPAPIASEAQEQRSSDKNKRLIAELRAKLRDSKAEVKTVAAEVSKLVRKSITPELVEKLGKRTFDNLVKVIEDATIRRDLEYAINRIEEVVLDLEIKDNQDKFNKFLDLRIQGESARGVSVAANVTDQTRQYITIIRDNLDRPASEVAALIEERGGTLAERTGLQVLEFYQDAKEHAHEVDDIEHDIAEIKVKNTKLRKDRAALNKAGKTVEARKLSEEIEQSKQLIENLNSERIVTKRSQLYYLGMAAGELEKEIAYGKEGHKEWLQAEVERKQQLINIAWNDIRDGKKIPILDQERSIWQKGADAIKDFLLAPAYSWDYLLKMISVNAPGGEGALYDHFMRSEYGYVESAAKYWISYNDFKDQLNKKAQEIFGKDYKQVLKDSNQALDVQIQLAAQYAKTHAATDENTKIREGASEVYTPTIGEVLYAYMAYKMADGKVKLDKMGLTEDKIDMLVRMISQQYIDFADWIQDEFLPERRKAYNKTHLEVFGTQMAQVENYVPLRVKKDFVYEEFDGSKVDTPQLPSSITGSIIKRKRNSLPIDLHTNVFDLMLDHGQQMEHWNAYTRIVRDTNQFLSNTQIRRALNFRNPSLHKKLKEAALIASNSYQPDVDRLEKMTVALSKMAASSKIAFRFNTAIKQVLSYPAFYAYVADGRFWWYLTRNISPDVYGRNFRWALDNIPSFQERWLGRMAGDDRLAQMTAPQLDQWIKRMGSVGMFANALVDATTCANGAQAVYRYEHERYKKAGLDDAEADRMAKIAAAQAINQTQQSSEGMYLSRIQADRTFFAVALSTFQNSNFAYLRKELEGIDQLLRKTEKQIANRTRYYENKGLSTDKAAKLAAEEVVKANRTAVAKILMFAFILNTIWTLGNSVWKFTFGDEDEEDTWQQATIRGFLNSWTRNLSIGQYVETLAWSDFRDLNPSLLLSDLNTFVDRIEKIADGEVKVWDRTAAWTVLSAISSLGVGVDLNSFASMYEGVAGAIDNGMNVEDVMLFLNAPRSQAKFIAGPPKEGETLDEYTKRQAWIERKIMSRIDKKQLDKWSRNYEAYKHAAMLGVPYLRDKTGTVKVPYIQEIEASYTDMLRQVGRTKAGAKRPDAEKISDDTLQRMKELDMVRRIKAINDLEKQFDAMVVMNEVYEARLKELCRAKQDLVNTWNK